MKSSTDIDKFKIKNPYPFLIRLRGNYGDGFYLINSDQDFINSMKSIFDIIYNDESTTYEYCYNQINSGATVASLFYKDNNLSIDAARSIIDKFPNSEIAQTLKADIKSSEDHYQYLKEQARNKLMFDELRDKIVDMESAIEVFKWVKLNASSVLIEGFINYDHSRK